MLDSDNFKKLEQAIHDYNDGKHKEAFEAFYRLADKEFEDDEAQYYLGLMYFNGHHVEKDKDEAIFWWKKSAKSRNQDAAFQLETFSMTRNTRY
jgi:TPR repeat protein